jgi:cysteine-rich repeat protein
MSQRPSGSVLRTALVACLVLAAGVHPRPAAAQCAGDCNETSQIEVVDVVIGMNIALGNASLESCPSWDLNGDARVSIDELLFGVSELQNGCPPAPPPPVVCGDGIQAVSEQCDDGNTVGGDGCSATCTLEAPGPVDQSWTGCNGSGSGGSVNINYADPIGQQFTPSQSQLTGLVVWVDTQFAPDGTSAPLTVSIHPASIDTAAIAEATHQVQRTGAQLVVFDPAVSVDPGSLYVLQLSSPSPLSWERAGADGTCNYAGGRPVYFGMPLGTDVAEEDLLFQTFAQP